jgi:hypothetical protein
VVAAAEQKTKRRKNNLELSQAIDAERTARPPQRRTDREIPLISLRPSGVPLRFLVTKNGKIAADPKRALRAGRG